MSNLASSCSAPSTVGNSSLVVWLLHLLEQHGPGEYVVQVKADGRVVVKRPRPPLRFEWGPSHSPAPSLTAQGVARGKE